jgi:putative dehydrogenase
MATIGFIGLGSMGRPMAANLLAAGHRVKGFDLNPAAMQYLAGLGGSVARSPAEAAADVDMLILMVVNAAQAESILLAEKALDAMRPGSIVALMATCPPGAVEKLAEQVLVSGRRFIDAPVSGGVAGAIDGSLTVMAAAQQEIFDEASAIFEAMASRIFKVGDAAGQGATVKAVNQLLCGVHIAAVAEAFSMAAKVGVDGKVLLEILSGSSASSWMLRDRGPRMLETKPQVTSAVDIFVKDLGIVMDAGREKKVALPLASMAHQFFLATSGRGDGLSDDSQLIRSYDLVNGNARV